MATNKPIKPTSELPDTWGGAQYPYTQEEITEGYLETVPQIVDGGKLNFEKDGLFRNIKYLRTIADTMLDAPAGEHVVVNSNNQFDYEKTGILGYSISKTYNLNDIVINVDGSNVKTYRSLISNNKGNDLNSQNAWEEVSISGANTNIGQIIQVLCAPDYIPFGTLPCDGTQYSASKFQTFWENYLAGEKPLLNTCSFTEWNNEVSSNGQCLKFAVDIANNLFKVPLIKDGTHLQQALNDSELSKFYTDGLPEMIISSVGGHTHTRGSMNITGTADVTQGASYNYNATGAFYRTTNGNGGNWDTGANCKLNFDASRNWTGETSSNGSHTHTISSNKIGKYDNVQPIAFGIRFFVIVANATRNETMMDWSQWQSDLQGKSNIDLNNLSDAGESHFDSRYLGYSQITNCITYIPQNINLELNDGVLTLKAGSKVCVPNGFEADGVTKKFDEIIIENDLTTTQSANGEMSIFYAPENNALLTFYSSASASGTTAPTDSKSFYNTADNTAYRYNGGVKETKLSFALGLTTSSNGALSFIDRVFNGLGIMGATVFALPGIRGKIPNGRNADGSLKNIDFETDKVLVVTKSGTYANQHIRLNSSEIDVGSMDYNKYKNFNYLGTNIRSYAVAGVITGSNNSFTSISPKTPFQVPDLNDINEYKITTSVSGTTWYRVYPDGWCEQGGRVNVGETSTVTVTYPKKFKDTNYSVLAVQTTQSTASNTEVGIQFTPSSATQGVISAHYLDPNTSTVSWQAKGYIA